MCKEGQHRYFVADTVGVEAEGTISVLIVCTSCGDSQCKTHQVSERGAARLQLKSQITNKE